MHIGSTHFVIKIQKHTSTLEEQNEITKIDIIYSKI